MNAAHLVLSVMLAASTADSFGFAKKAPPPVAPPIVLPPNQNHGEFVLRVMTYNIHGLPAPSNDTTRFRDIGRELKSRRNRGVAPHVVAVQEAFTNWYRDMIQESGYRYKKDGNGPGGGGAIVGSGLSILSDLPMTAAQNRDFDANNLVGFDWQARKGMQYVQVRIPGLSTPINFFNTHMQADYDDWTASLQESISARMRQQTELQRFLYDLASPYGPAVFVGDFNTRVGLPDYSGLGRQLALENSAEPCSIRGVCETTVDPLQDIGRSLDHQYYRTSPEGIIMIPIYYSKEFKTRVNGRLLSDHEALEVHYRIAW